MLNQKCQNENDQARQNTSSNKERIQQLEIALQKYQMEIKLNEDNKKQINELKDTARKLQMQECLKENPVINYMPKTLCRHVISRKPTQFHKLRNASCSNAANEIDYVSGTT